MEKKLLHSEDACVQLVLSVTRDDFRITEDLLGIEFAHTNGEFMSDFDRLEGSADYNYTKIEELEKLDVDTSKWRKRPKETGLPTEFPCIAVYWIEDSFDRFGKVGIQILDFVYLSDFQNKLNGFVIYYPDTKFYNMTSGFEVPFVEATVYRTYDEALEEAHWLTGVWEIVKIPEGRSGR